MSKRLINILQLYPQNMNIYGDFGNVLVLKRRLEWRGYDVKLLAYNCGDTFPDDVDIVVGGGGQDSGQKAIQADLLLISSRLKELANDDMPMLVICGMYQLFGNFFETISGEKIEGIGLFNMETYGKEERLIGNIVTSSNKFGKIIGYENHSGQTFLAKGVEPLSRVNLGAGNNMIDATEGACYRNVIGSYLHGSLLPKNPAIADFLIEKAVSRKYGDFIATEIDDSLATHARKIARKRPR